jgi:hypothetical protein
MTALQAEQYPATDLPWEPQPYREEYDPALDYELRGAQYGYWRSCPEAVPEHLRDYHCYVLGYSPYASSEAYAVPSQTYNVPTEPDPLQDTGQRAFDAFWYDGQPQAKSTTPTWAQADYLPQTAEPEATAPVQASEAKPEQLVYERGRHRRKEKSLVRKGLEVMGRCLGGTALGAIGILAYGIATRR